MKDLTEIRPEHQSDLAVVISDKAIQALEHQRVQLQKFVTGQLKKGINGDYAQIPGTPKPSLLKPGAEKLANIFKLGNRVVKSDKDIDHKSNFAMFTYAVEIFHIPSGRAIAQCEGSANSHEKKFKERKIYEYNNGKRIEKGYEPTPIADILNTLQKMAQKRAFVGAVINAVGASDFFTQDVEEFAASKNQAEPQANQSGELSEKQLKRLFAICNAQGWSHEQTKQYMTRAFGVESSRDLNRQTYDLLINVIEKSSFEDAIGEVDEK